MSMTSWHHRIMISSIYDIIDFFGSFDISYDIIWQARIRAQNEQVAINTPFADLKVLSLALARFSKEQIADTRQMLRCDRIGAAVPAAAAAIVVAARGSAAAEAAAQSGGARCHCKTMTQSPSHDQASLAGPPAAAAWHSFRVKIMMFILTPEAHQCSARTRTRTPAESHRARSRTGVTRVAVQPEPRAGRPDGISAPAH